MSIAQTFGKMTSRSDSREGDFEVVPPRNSQKFLSMSSPTEGDPYENRSDIKETKCVIENILQKLHFKNENDIDELHEKLKSRDALDAGIGGEIANLEDIANNDNLASEPLRNAAEKAKEHIAKARQLACESKTTVKRALDLLETTLPVFVRACEISKENPELSADFIQLQDLYKNTMHEMKHHQQAFEMEQREIKLAEGKNLLERSISAATDDRARVSEELANEDKLRQMEQFIQAQSEVELMIGEENKELDAWLVSCRSDISSLEEERQLQRERYSDATVNYEGRLKSIDITLDVNSKRQAELLKQLDLLKAEENRLRNNRMYETQVQETATKLDTSVSAELESIQKKVSDIQGHASTAQEIILLMHQCSSLLFSTAIETQKQKEERLRQLEIEALTREGTALATAAVEFKVQIQMGEDNIKEYSEQVVAIRKEIEKAAKKGQTLTVSKKKQELDEYKQEMDKDNESNAENCQKLEKMMASVKIVNDKLDEFGVTMPEVDSLFRQRMEDVLLENEPSGPTSMFSM